MEAYFVRESYKVGQTDFVFLFFKRTLDVIFSLVALLLFSPLILLIYWMIKRQNDGPVLFKQERIGRYGKPFMLYKFRTMTTKAEDAGPQLCATNDARLTPVGKFLREHHLDEFPQLWNVLKGDMSFVGHRPERKYFIDQITKYDSDYELLYELRPGLFSEATLYNGYTDTIHKMLERLRYDIEYLHTCSIQKDFRIIFLTSMAIIFGKKF